MTNQNSADVIVETAASDDAKRAYASPSLTSLGNIAELVRNAEGTGTDGGFLDSDSFS